MGSERTKQPAPAERDAVAAESTPSRRRSEVALRAALDRSGGEPARSRSDESALSATLTSSAAAGRPLEAPLRAEMEARLGRHLQGVRVHTDGTAHEVTRSVGAKAITRGRDIWFARGRGPHERTLLAHELAHVVQQREGAAAALVGTEGDAAVRATLESQADAAAAGSRLPSSATPAATPTNAAAATAATQLSLEDDLAPVLHGTTRGAAATAQYRQLLAICQRASPAEARRLVAQLRMPTAARRALPEAHLVNRFHHVLGVTEQGRLLDILDRRAAAAEPLAEAATPSASPGVAATTPTPAGAASSAANSIALVRSELDARLREYERLDDEVETHLGRFRLDGATQLDNAVRLQRLSQRIRALRHGLDLLLVAAVSEPPASTVELPAGADALRDEIADRMAREDRGPLPREVRDWSANLESAARSESARLLRTRAATRMLRESLASANPDERLAPGRAILAAVERLAPLRRAARPAPAGDVQLAGATDAQPADAGDRSDGPATSRAPAVGDPAADLARRFEHWTPLPESVVRAAATSWITHAAALRAEHRQLRIDELRHLSDTYVLLRRRGAFDHLDDELRSGAESLYAWLLATERPIEDAMRAAADPDPLLMTSYGTYRRHELWQVAGRLVPPHVLRSLDLRNPGTTIAIAQGVDSPDFFARTELYGQLWNLTSSFAATPVSAPSSVSESNVAAEVRPVGGGAAMEGAVVAPNAGLSGGITLPTTRAPVEPMPAFGMYGELRPPESWPRDERAPPGSGPPPPTGGEAGTPRAPGPVPELELYQRQRLAALDERVQRLEADAAALERDSNQRAAEARALAGRNPERGEIIATQSLFARRRSRMRLLEAARLRREANEVRTGRRDPLDVVPDPSVLDDLMYPLQYDPSVGTGRSIRTGERFPGQSPRSLRRVMQSRSGNRVVFRIQGGGASATSGGRALVTVDGAGNVRIADTNILHVNFGSPERAREFFEMRGGFATNAEVVMFEVSEDWIRSLRSSGVPEFGSAAPRTVPQTVDVAYAEDQLSIPGPLLGQLQRFIVPGSGRVWPPRGRPPGRRALPIASDSPTTPPPGTPPPTGAPPTSTPPTPVAAPPAAFRAPTAGDWFARRGGGINVTGDLYRVLPHRPGVFDLMAHGERDTVRLPAEFMARYGAVTADARMIADFLFQSGYQRGAPVRLVACSSGASPRGIAQQLANLLGVTVWAPTTDLDGITGDLLDNGRWQPFAPGVSIPSMGGPNVPLIRR